MDEVHSTVQLGTSTFKLHLLLRLKTYYKFLYMEFGGGVCYY